MHSSKLANVYKNSGVTDKEKVEASIQFLQHYVNTYTYGTCCSGNALVFVNDILYGLGLAVSPETYQQSDGFSKFKEKLFSGSTDWKFGE